MNGNWAIGVSIQSNGRKKEGRKKQKKGRKKKRNRRRKRGGKRERKKILPTSCVFQKIITGTCGKVVGGLVVWMRKLGN